MTERNLLAALMKTPLVSSFFADAREGNLYDSDRKLRASAWSHWALSNMSEMTGSAGRKYIALMLPGKFYNPLGNGPEVQPHIELPDWALDRSDGDFADRLGQIGNAALFNWWVMPEVTAMRRVLFSRTGEGVCEFIDEISKHRRGLIDTLLSLNKTMASQWMVIEKLQAAQPESVSSTITEPYLPNELSKLFPPSIEMGLEIRFDEKLAQSSGSGASRRLGAWRVDIQSGSNGSLGVVTPRITGNSLFSDKLFIPEKESTSALLVRAIMLRRLAWRYLDSEVPNALQPDISTLHPYHLRSMIPRVGAKLPEPSIDAAVAFVQRNPIAIDAWGNLNIWAKDKTILTVNKEDFLGAHERALASIRRAESPTREDINNILPLGWDSKNRVVRVTYSRNPENI